MSNDSNFKNINFPFLDLITLSIDRVPDSASLHQVAALSGEKEEVWGRKEYEGESRPCCDGHNQMANCAN